MNSGRFDQRFIYLAVAVAAGLFLYLPFDLPVGVDPEVRRFFDAIEDLDPGTRVVLSADYGPASEPEIGPMHENVLLHLFHRKARVICVSFWEYGPQLTEKYLGIAAALARRQWGVEQIDGADYVELPFLSGDDVAMLNVAMSISAALPYTAARGGVSRETRSLPIMEGVVGFARDAATGERAIACLIELGSGEPGVREWIRNAGRRFDMPILAGVASVMATDLYPFMHSGQLAGFLGGLPGAQQYELLLREAGIREDASRVDRDMAVQSALHLLIIGLIVAGNAAVLRARVRRRRARC